MPKIKDLSDEKNQRPTICLNNPYKLLTGLVAQYMGGHAMENNIWDEGQQEAVGRALGIVDQFTIGRYIMEETMTYHQNLAMAFHDNKKAYGKVHYG